MTFDKLCDPGDFASLDAKLASTLCKLAHGELGREIVQQQETAAKRGHMLKGRQILFMIFEHFAVSTNAGLCFSITDLLSVRLTEDRLEQFLLNWEYVLNGIDTMPPDQEIE